MTIDAEKKEIIQEILKTDDEWILKAIRKLLDLHVDDLPDFHKQILRERTEEYNKNPDNVIDWDELKSELLKE